MGLLDKGRQAQADKVGAAAKDAWDGGDLAYVHLFAFGAGESGMSKQVGEILAVGWRLGGTAMSHAGNLGQAMFTFVRP